jgi:hypothetical protein
LPTWRIIREDLVLIVSLGQEHSFVIFTLDLKIFTGSSVTHGPSTNTPSVIGKQYNNRPQQQPVGPQKGMLVIFLTFSWTVGNFVIFVFSIL